MSIEFTEHKCNGAAIYDFFAQMCIRPFNYINSNNNGICPQVIEYASECGTSELHRSYAFKGHISKIKSRASYEMIGELHRCEVICMHQAEWKMRIYRNSIDHGMRKKRIDLQPIKHLWFMKNYLAWWKIKLDTEGSWTNNTK